MKNLIKTMIKRDGKEVIFQPDKITRAIYKAMLSVKIGSMKDAELLTQKVVASLSNDFTKPTVEQVQDRVETILMGTQIDGRKFNEVAKSYILYRERRRTIRLEKERMGVRDDLKLSLNAIKVLESRYLLKDQEGKIIETPGQMFRRVAEHVGIIDAIYDFISYQKDGVLKEGSSKISS
ncbi:MAG: ATP cone domain-containing protein, partial [Thermoplasmataceae archaeon]